MNIENLKEKIEMDVYYNTVLFQKFKYQKNGLVPILYPRLQKSSHLPRTERIFEILWGKLEIIQFILSDKHMDGPGQDQRHFFRKSVY